MRNLRALTSLGFYAIKDGLENLPARRIVTVPSGLAPARITAFFDAVSYTHLTLPTNREV